MLLLLFGLFLFLFRFKLWSLLMTLVAALLTARRERKVHSQQIANRCNIDGLPFGRHTHWDRKDVPEPACSKVEVRTHHTCKCTEISSQENLWTTRLRRIDVPVACSPQDALTVGSLWALDSSLTLPLCFSLSVPRDSLVKSTHHVGNFMWNVQGTLKIVLSEKWPSMGTGRVSYINETKPEPEDRVSGSGLARSSSLSFNH